MPKPKRTEPVTDPISPEPATPPEAPSRGKGRPKLANPKPTNPIILAVRAKPEYQAWFDDLTEAVGRSVGVGKVDRVFVFDRAVRDLAKAMGLPEPPERY